MAASASEILDILQDTMRGLEADRIRAQVLAVADEWQAERVGILDAQIVEAQRRIDEAQKEVAAEADKSAQNARDAGVAAVESADAATFTDDYDTLTVVQLKERANLKGITNQLRSDDRKADIINVLRADDLRGPRGT